MWICLMGWDSWYPKFCGKSYVENSMEISGLLAYDTSYNINADLQNSSVSFILVHCSKRTVCAGAWFGPGLRFTRFCAQLRHSIQQTSWIIILRLGYCWIRWCDMEAINLSPSQKRERAMRWNDLRIQFRNIIRYHSTITIFMFLKTCPRRKSLKRSCSLIVQLQKYIHIVWIQKIRYNISTTLHVGKNRQWYDVVDVDIVGRREMG